MKIIIIGTRGIPNNYGGFEQFAEYLSIGLAEKGHDVTVTSPHSHPYKSAQYKGVKIKHFYSPEGVLKSSANFFYDWLALKYAIREQFDIIYEAGYQSSAVSIWRFNKSKTLPIVINMDGLEWKRSKWNYFTRKLTIHFEKVAVNYCDCLIADNIGIKKYIQEKYTKQCYFIPYGADLIMNFDEGLLTRYNLQRKNYYLAISRIEPENNLELILDGFLESNSELPFVMIGNINNSYSKKLIKKYGHIKRIRFYSSIYDKKILDSLRYFSKIYFHGHSVGGTNPSLLEAMGCQSYICAHDNPFNRSVLEENALYFCDVHSLKIQIQNYSESNQRIEFIKNNVKKITEKYSWSKIVDEYEALFRKLIKK